MSILLFKKSASQRLCPGYDNDFMLTFLVHLFSSPLPNVGCSMWPAVSYRSSSLKHWICIATLVCTAHTVLYFVPNSILFGTFLTAAYTVGSQLEAGRITFDLPAPYRFPMTFLIFSSGFLLYTSQHHFWTTFKYIAPCIMDSHQ